MYLELDQTFVRLVLLDGGAVIDVMVSSPEISDWTPEAAVSFAVTKHNCLYISIYAHSVPQGNTVPHCVTSVRSFGRCHT